MHPAGIVNSQHIVIGSSLRFYKIGWFREEIFQQPVVNETILARGKHMVAEVEIVARMVNQLEREHAASCLLGLRRATVLLNRDIVLLNRFRELVPAGTIR